MSHFGVPQEEEGGQKKVVTKEDEIRNLLQLIYRELIVTNLHLSSLTNIDIKSEEVG